MLCRLLVLLLLLLDSPLELSLAVNNNPNSDKKHLVILSHGLMGSERDLKFLGERLESKGVRVLFSSANRLTASMQGVEAGARRLVQEVEHVIYNNPDIEKISFVGNSLGGIYARFALMLYEDIKPRGLEFHKFLTIATPHLSVRSHLYVEQEFGIQLPAILKSMVSKVLQRTGKELLLEEEDDLLHQMGCNESFLAPLRAFRERRLYANLASDFMVPLGTAAFLEDHEVAGLRAQYSQSSGIVSVIDHRPTTSDWASEGCGSDSGDKVQQMRIGLNSMSWSKHVVSFSMAFLFLPLAHNMIAALRKSPEWFFVKFLGTGEGDYIMEHAADWLSA